MIDRSVGGGLRPVVFKIGGSLSEHPQLRAWMQAMATHGGGRVVVVPGGGPHAMLVRRAQGRWGFDDRAAHDMALLAMDQYARLLVAIEPGMMLATLEPQVRGLLGRGKSVVLAPSAMLAGEPSIEASWDVTSDSLSLWVAQRLGASALVLVKSVAPAPGRHDAAMLAGRGIIDRAFPRQLAISPLPVWWLGPENPHGARLLLEGGRGQGEIVSPG
jgi:aspartokinase-like uncharacterized kinase